MRNLVIAFLCSCVSICTAQTVQDTARILNTITIEAFASGRSSLETGASISVLDTAVFQRFNTISMLPAVNMVAGVRMEERSPGSFRFSIRGSLLRSPFGVRNVKAYWNGLPLTDAGGNTYLNVFDLSAIGSMEIIKGPAASLYGAGTGGVILLKSPTIKQDGIKFSATVGSFGLQRYQLNAQTHSEKLNARVSLINQQTDGYREQSAMRRKSIHADLDFNPGNKSVWSATMFYSDLFYETPGGLTEEQYNLNPKLARPSTATQLGAIEQYAAVNNQTYYAGLTNDFTLSDDVVSTTGIYLSGTHFENPTIRNYEIRKELNYGIRNQTDYSTKTETLANKLTFGFEYQHFQGPLDVYDNAKGVRGNIQTSDDLASNLFTVFLQDNFSINEDLIITAGASANFLKYDFKRNYPEPSLDQKRNFGAVLSPRVSILKKVRKNISSYISVSKGFSPPSFAEVRPSTNTYNGSIKPENGTNYEFGLKSNLLANKLLIDFAVYDFRLQNTIVIQRDEQGADFFVNAGKTVQRGVETCVGYIIINNSAHAINDLKFFTSFTYNHYRFKDYTQDAVDYSDNELTGVAPVVVNTGFDLSLLRKFYMRATLNYTDHIPLNDANTIYAREYYLLGIKAGYKTNIKKSLLEFFAGIDNALDQRYSLGNDLHAVGGRYFNAAPARNYYAGLNFSLQ